MNLPKAICGHLILARPNLLMNIRRSDDLPASPFDADGIVSDADCQFAVSICELLQMAQLWPSPIRDQTTLGRQLN